MSILKRKRILIIAPHPDDEAICCGGLIMAAKKEGAKVFVLFGSIGTSRQLVTGKTDPATRINEAIYASKYGNFKYSLMFQGEEFMKLDIVPQKHLIDIIEDKIEQFKPDIVCIPFGGSFDQDHRSLHSASITALRPTPKTLRHQVKTILEQEEPYAWKNNRGFEPNIYLDISEVLEEKIKLLKCHKTQLREDPFPRSPENLKRLAGLRGAEISVKYAEAFHILRGVWE